MMVYPSLRYLTSTVQLKNSAGELHDQSVGIKPLMQDCVLNLLHADTFVQRHPRCRRCWARRTVAPRD
jgi:hypothetical protein